MSRAIWAPKPWRRATTSAAAVAGNRSQMRKAIDHSRDQSYFLFATTQDQLDYLRFPLADLEKPQVRGVAAELGLKIAAKPDSQDICFVPSGDYRTLIDRLRPQGPRSR